MARTLILGGGFGGLAVATELRRLDPGHEVVLVDRSPTFSMGLRKLWQLVGHATIWEGSRPRAALRGHGIRVVEAEVTAIDPAARAAVVGGETLEADHLVVALGAEARPDLVPGLAEHAHDVWQVANVAAAQDALSGFAGGRLGIAIAGVPYTCPPAPYECAFLVDELLRARGVREGTELFVTTPQPLLLPNAGEAGSRWIGEQLDARGIEWAVGAAVGRIEAGRVVYGDAVREVDLLIAVPPHRPPAVIAASGLAGEHGWVGVRQETLETASPGVYAVGDVTHIALANGLPLPKAGVIAEAEGLVVAAAIAAAATGAPQPPPFDGHGYCFLEAGLGEAAVVEGDFFASPAPRVELAPPTAERAEAKRRFEAERLDRWFA